MTETILKKEDKVFEEKFINNFSDGHEEIKIEIYKNKEKVCASYDIKLYEYDYIVRKEVRAGGMYETKRFKTVDEAMNWIESLKSKYNLK